MQVETDRPPIEMRVPATAWGPRLARRFVAARLHEHEVHDDVVATAALVTSELVTNSVMHATCSAPVVIRIGTTADEVTIAVCDRRSVALPPIPTNVVMPPPSAERGRGLALVERLSDRWGVDVRDGERAVWCAFKR